MYFDYLGYILLYHRYRAAIESESDLITVLGLCDFCKFSFRKLGNLVL